MACPFFSPLKSCNTNMLIQPRGWFDSKNSRGKSIKASASAPDLTALDLTRRYSTMLNLKRILLSNQKVGLISTSEGKPIKAFAFALDGTKPSATERYSTRPDSTASNCTLLDVQSTTCPRIFLSNQGIGLVSYSEGKPIMASAFALYPTQFYWPEEYCTSL